MHCVCRQLMPWWREAELLALMRINLGDPECVSRCAWVLKIVGVVMPAQSMLMAGALDTCLTPDASWEPFSH